jgi:hypothetical protein
MYTGDRVKITNWKYYKQKCELHALSLLFTYAHYFLLNSVLNFVPCCRNTTTRVSQRS